MDDRLDSVKITVGRVSTVDDQLDFFATLADADRVEAMVALVLEPTGAGRFKCHVSTLGTSPVTARQMLKLALEVIDDILEHEKGE